MPATTKWGLPYPTQVAAGPGPDVPADIKALADATATKLTPQGRGLFADRPAFGINTAGQRYYATDTGHEYLDIGTAWAEVTPTLGAGSVGTSQLAGGAVTGPKVGDLELTGGKLANTTIDGNAKLIDGTVVRGKLAADMKPSTGAASGAEALRALGTSAGQAYPGTSGAAETTNRVAQDDLLYRRSPIHGTINGDGSKAHGLNRFTCYRITNGQYRITAINGEFDSNTDQIVIHAQPFAIGGSKIFVNQVTVGANYGDIQLLRDTGVPVDVDFGFTMVQIIDP